MGLFRRNRIREEPPQEAPREPARNSDLFLVQAMSAPRVTPPKNEDASASPAISGKLAGNAFLEMLQMLGMAKSSGTLSVREAEKIAHFAIHNGQILCATFEEGAKLGEMLVYSGIIRHDVLEAVLGMQRRKRSHQPFGRILLELGLVTRPVLLDVVEAQILSVCAEVRAWSEVSFEFQPSGEFEGCRQMPVPGMTIDTLLINFAAA